MSLIYTIFPLSIEGFGAPFVFVLGYYFLSLLKAKFVLGRSF